MIPKILEEKIIRCADLYKSAIDLEKVIETDLENLGYNIDSLRNGSGIGLDELQRGQVPNYTIWDNVYINKSIKNKKDIVELYTDGSCIENPGPGGWAYIIKFSDYNTFELSGYELNTTNNRMEILAVINGLKAINNLNFKDLEIKVFSDSQYVINTMTKNWSKKKNTDLWLMLTSIVDKLKLKGLKIKWVWVKGHADNKYNNMCDKRALSEAINALNNK